MMKKYMMLLAGLWILAGTASAKRPTQLSELPAAAQQFVRDHFADGRVKHVRMEGRLADRDYEVVFVDGTHVRFDKHGNWDEIYTHYGKIPATVLPQKARTYMREHYPEVPMTGVEHDRKGYEIELSNGLELDFGPDGSLLSGHRLL